MKKILLIIFHTFILFYAFNSQAQKFSEGDINFLKQMRKSLYQKFYTPDSLISKTIDPATTFPWQSTTFKNSASIIDTLKATTTSERSSDYFSLWAYFPVGTPEEDCKLFTAKLISYSLFNEKNEKVELSTQGTYSGIGQYYRNGKFTRSTFQFKCTPIVPAKTYKGFVEYEIIAPAAFNSITITKADTGKTIVINELKLTVLDFKNNYVALKGDTATLKELNFDYMGTDNTNKKYQRKYTQEKGYKTALGKSSFIISEEMYYYYISHPKLSDKQLDDYLTDYFKRHADSPVASEAQILIIQDIGYIKKMFCYWPTSFITKRFKEPIDLKY